MKLLENVESHAWLTLEACDLSLWTGLLWWLPVPLSIELRPLTMLSRSRCGTSSPATLPLAYSTLDLLVFSQTTRPVASDWSALHLQHFIEVSSSQRAFPDHLPSSSLFPLSCFIVLHSPYWYLKLYFYFFCLFYSLVHCLLCKNLSSPRL